jgi:hypothetical protein
MSEQLSDTETALWPTWYLVAVLRAMAELIAQGINDDQVAHYWKAYADARLIP